MDILGKIVGVESIDDLTKTQSRFTVKTASSTNSGDLFDGDDEYYQCWTKWQIPFWYYAVESCMVEYNLSSSTYMYVNTEGEYSHDLVDAFGCSVSTRAIAPGNKAIDDAFSYFCTQSSKPPESALECEFSAKYLGYY